MSDRPTSLREAYARAQEQKRTPEPNPDTVLREAAAAEKYADVDRLISNPGAVAVLPDEQRRQVADRAAYLARRKEAGQ